MGFLLRDNEETESDYGFYGSTSFGTFYIERFEFGAHPEAPQTIIAMADASKFPFVAGVNYHVEGSVVGKKISMKFWKVGDPEPGIPQLTVTDKTLKPGFGNRLSAVVFIDPAPLIQAGVGQVVVNGAFDDIHFHARRLSLRWRLSPRPAVKWHALRHFLNLSPFKRGSLAPARILCVWLSCGTKLAMQAMQVL